MIFKGVNVEYKCIPVLDTEFVPLALFVKRYQKNAHMPVNIEISGAGRSSNYHTFIIGNQNSLESDIFYLERCIKALLWCRGGNIVRLYSDCEFLREIIRELSRIYHTEGERSFDVKTMSDIFEKPFIIGSSAYKEMQNDCQETEKKYIKTTEKKADGFRLGIDLGGSSIKISALSDGNVIFSDRTEWRPFQESNASYHYNKILEALKLGADKLPHVDFIGISSAGIIINNRIRLSSLFLSVPKERFETDVSDIYCRACAEAGSEIPFAVANDGDVSALSGAIRLKDGSVLGIALGSSEAGGYVDTNGHVTGFLNELAFVPIDISNEAVFDEWSGDKGCGSHYLSVKAALRLAEKAGITLSGSLSDSAKVHEIQKLTEIAASKSGALSEAPAVKVFKTIGCYLGHAIALYNSFYTFRHIVLMGGIVSGYAGEIIAEECKKVLLEDYYEYNIDIVLPEEEQRRAGQSIAAALLI